ncbi:glycosyltransferase [Rhizobium sp. L51/94]|uniref:glycosyltransferase n=1 Tax=Rhizobium sp. L51/94 TaxID=2819999 RepID=UPI001C5A821B|nr:glycosyltransferase [Rhizobium sp. L51/94]QXZ80905.1 glycosyltransferase [Rhizobium sp. L51/94]
MTRAPIAFLDHPFHKKTKSSNFFIDILSKEFDVHVFYLEGDPREMMRELGDSNYETVICWQTEFCAPYFLMRGKRVVCVPMYDGVANAPDWYWLPMRQARFVNFSRTLHQRHRALGIESIYVKYFGTAKDHEQATFETLRGIFWQRRPQEGLDSRFARRVLGRVVDELHIHNAPDTEDALEWEPQDDATVSYFTREGNTYREALKSSNVFLCPRRTEGIGHPLIEAMARGMCIVAHNLPTANEYIVDGVNGILIDYDNPSSFEALSPRRLSNSRAEKLGKQARSTYLRGRNEWQKSENSLPYFVQTVPEPDFTEKDVSFADRYLKISRYAHSDFYRYLHELLNLQRSGLLGSEASSLSLREIIKWRLIGVPGSRMAWRLTKRFGRRVRSVFR